MKTEIKNPITLYRIFNFCLLVSGEGISSIISFRLLLKILPGFFGIIVIHQYTAWEILFSI